MLCRNPYVSMGRAFGCGQCMPCRVNRRRIWSHRIMLETLSHGDNSFVSLTYEDARLPMKDGQATLVPEHLQGFFKRLRRKIEPLRIRYFGVGEYGSETFRPHYHIALFGYPVCEAGMTRMRMGGTGFSRCCSVCETVSSVWPHGNVMIGSLTMQSAAYIAGYVTKKMTSKDDPRLGGRAPEFARMSLRPGIGQSAMWEVASSLLEYELDGLEDVPGTLRHGGRELPLGRYLRRELRALIGRGKETPDGVMEKMAEEMRPLREAAFENSESFAETIVKVNEPRYDRMAARERIFKKGERL